jgi:hypothetical protein
VFSPRWPGSVIGRSSIGGIDRGGALHAHLVH